MENKEKAKVVWQVVTAVLTLKEEAHALDVDGHLKKAPKPHVMAVQFILLGSGFATKELIADGDYGNQSIASIVKLFNTAC